MKTSSATRAPAPLDKKGEDCENCPHDVDAGAPCPAMATRAKTTSDAKGDVSMVLRAKYI